MTEGPARLDLLVGRTVDVVIAGFAWFTVLCHLWNAVGWRVDSLMLTWAISGLLAFVAVAWRWRCTGPRAPVVRSAPRLRNVPAGWQRPLRGVVVGVAVAGAALLAQHHRGWWRAGWALGLAAVAGGVLLVLVSRDAEDVSDDDPAPTVEPGRRRVSTGAVVALAVAVAFGVLSLFVLHFDADDAYYVNRITWVAQHATLADRDTMFSFNALPALYTPVVSTFEVFAGGVARGLGIAGPTAAYLVLGPLLCAFIPLALWRSIRSVRLSRPLLGLCLALVVLVFSGGGPHWFGALVLRRTWQTKMVYAAAVVPLIYGYAAEWGRSRRRRHAALLVLAGITAVGFTSSAAGLVPATLALIAVGMWLTCGVRSLFPLAAAAIYPIACLLVYRSGSAADEFGTTAAPHFNRAYDVWQFFEGTGTIGLIVAAALTLGWLGSRSPQVRAMLVLPSLAVLIALAPGVLEWAGPLLGGAPVAWRVLWLLPWPLLLAAVPSAGEAGVAALARGLGQRLRRVIAPVLAAALAVATVVAGVPITAASTQTQVLAQAAWDLPPAWLVDARRLIALARPGQTVAAPPFVDTVVAIISTRVLALDARDYYGQLIAKRAPASFRMRERSQLQRWLAGDFDLVPNDTEARRLRAWPVSVACLAAPAANVGRFRARALLAAGYRPVGRAGRCLLFVSR